MGSWSLDTAKNRIVNVLAATGLRFCETKYRTHPDNVGWTVSYRSDGIQLSQHRKSWQKKREEQYLVRCEYVWGGRTIYTRTEPWVNFPSDLLVAQLMLLPVEVKK